jgi:hypothetical protein
MATTTPNYGWPVPTSTDYVKDGATAIEALGDAIDATVFGLPTGALTLVKTQAVGTGVASVTVTSCFSSTYDNYKILYTDGTITGQVKMQLTGITSGYAYNDAYALWGGGYNGGGSASSASFSAGERYVNFELYNPNLAKFKSGFAIGNDAAATLYYNMYNASTTQATGFNISATSFTGGTIRVYGYGKS